MVAFYPGFDITADKDNLSFIYGADVFGPEIEKRELDDIRKSLRNPQTDGPEVPYAIAMDIGKKKDKINLEKRFLLYGAVIYSKGSLGEEPIRSQGHIHAISPSCGSSTPEVYEIWEGKAIIYMQETARNDPGKCFAVYVKEGGVVIVPPNWAHCTVNANPDKNMIFGAWCIRDFGFEYADIRAHGGLAYFPILKEENKIAWVRNEAYDASTLIEKSAREYPEFNLKKGVPIYTQYEQNNELFNFVTKPFIAENIWSDYEP
ncbi:glucose-6-phosphate isomerase family protein [Tetragenococcus halophilus]|uniref:glucose-6-phosphate isomerase family protein n=1 Tax=Tetragenococcus halophilus TaxID=51669 RepID=UPI000B92ACBE|nr:glucose-6-phosphate isomerase family protein [Tetragenococcus halophilus]